MAHLSSEILLRIFGFLDDPRDLVQCRQSSRRMYNVAGDALLWRDLFVHTFLRSHRSEVTTETPTKKRRKLSTTYTPAGTIPSRVIRQIPRMQQDLFVETEQRNDEDDSRVDWYALYKISHNWQTGSFSTRYLQKHVNATQEDDLTSSAGPSQYSKVAPATRNLRTLVDSTNTHIFAAFNPITDTDCSPAILVFPSDGKARIEEEGKQESIASYKFPSPKDRGKLLITSLAVDRSQSSDGSIKLFVGCSNGSSSLIIFHRRDNTFSTPINLSETSTDLIVAAVLTLPLLVTCTASFHLRLYRVDKSNVTLLEERRTYSCHWPASLRLEPVSEGSSSLEKAYRFSIAYSTPVYPLGWTVGLQEIIIREDCPTSSRSATARKAFVVTQVDSPSTQDRKRIPSIDRPSLDERRQQVGRLTSLSYEDPYIVVGTKDNEVICFKVEGAASSDTRNEHLCLSHICNFQGHTGTVHSVSLSEGRCVTGGSDGSVRVWRLGDEEASLAKATGLLATFDARLRRGLGKVISISSSLQSTGKRKREEATHPLSLADILRDNRTTSVVGSASSTSAIVRLVSSAFDRIISVSSIRSTLPISSNRRIQSGHCRVEAIEEEQVQIWSFA